MNNAWLIGVYTIEMENRIEELGYSISQVYATPEAVDSFESAPDLIVFSDEGSSDLNEMELMRHVFPSSLIVSIPASHVFMENCLTFGQRKSGEQSVARLLSQIYEREHRWDN
jgi:hypothetical protein